jgi:formylglycine-generating enzyme required for sulfatase activity
MKKHTATRLTQMVLGILIIFLPILACSFPLLDSTNEPLPAATEVIEEGENLDPESPIIATETLINVEIPKPKLGSTLRWVDTSLLVYIPPGEFIMGFDDQTIPEDETEDHSEHVVDLDGFWIYRTEVTNRMYLHCMSKGQCSAPAVDPSIPDLEDPEIADHPVVGVHWNQAANYCESVGGFLPTEAQWEKTARGPDGSVYPWGETEPSCELLNFNNCLGDTSAVLDYPNGASPYEVLDLAGNVFEWVADWYQEDYYESSPFENPLGPDHGEVRSVRGSTFRTGQDQVESFLRYFLEPDKYRSDLGFRCVVGNAQEYAPLCSVLADNSPEIADNPDDPPGGSASCIVQEPTLSVVTYCENGQRGNNLSWSPADADINYSSSTGVSCSQYDVDTLACVGNYGGTIDIEACKSCPPPVVELGVLANCDPPYNYDDATKLCKYDGPSIPGEWVCAPGYSLSGDDSCCAMEEGTPLDFPICPVGGDYDPISQICWFTLPSTGDEKCVSESVFFRWCAGEREPEPSGCSQYGPNDCEKMGCTWDPAVGCLEP